MASHAEGGMMDDRELLELAARACGFGDPKKGRTCWTESEYPKGSGQNGALWNYVGYMDTAELFNPLTSDADAFRLAVDLDLIVSRDYLTGERTVLKYKANTLEQLVRIAESLGDNPHAATRRAIVRAAAAITQEMTDAQG